MKYSVITNLSFTTPALRGNLQQAVQTWLIGKSIWGAIETGAGLDMTGKPNYTLSVRFDSIVDMDDLFSFIMQRMIAIPVLSGRVSKHPCSHDEQQPVSCIIEDEFIK